LNYPVTLINHITIPPFSEQMIEAKILQGNMTEALFEPNIRLQNKALFTPNALLNVQNKTIKISIVNATNRQRTLSERTKVGMATSISTLIGSVIPRNYLRERIPEGKACAKLISEGKGASMNDGLDSRHTQATTSYETSHQCRECHQYFTTRNDLFKHLRNRCYPNEIQEQINKLIAHISDDKQREKIANILWKYGKLFDTSEPSKIDITLKNAIDIGNHRPIHTAPYRRSNKDQETLRDGP
jgi:hypothetical protein